MSEKTELVKTIAEVMFDNEESLIRIDMSEYMEKHSVSKIKSAHLRDMSDMMMPVSLQKKVRRKPYSVIIA